MANSEVFCCHPQTGPNAESELRLGWGAGGGHGRRPPLSPARAPPQGLFEFDQTGGFDPADPEPISEFEFDQSLPD